jgi:asparagine synthetase B (glutamine-hydrolysing)
MAALEDQAATEDKAAVLPGGVDSALVAAGLCRPGKQVETFSFDYTDGKYNQPHTDTVAKHPGITHNWIPVTGEMIATGLENFRNEFNAPTNWPNYVIQTKVVCEEIRQRGYYYCYSGDGCDTIFLGYPGTHRRTSLLTRLPALPDWLVNLLLFLTAIKPLERRTGHPYRVLLNIIRSLKRKMPERGHVTLRIFDEISLAQLREGPAPEQAMDTEDILEKLAAPLSALSPIRLGYHGKSLISPNKNKIIGSSDNTGVVIHSPYLHPGLKQLAASMSDTLNRPREKTAAAVTGKYILLRMAEEKGLLPREVIYQKKLAAVAAPIDDWYMGPLKNRLMKILQDLPFETSQNYLDSLFADKLAERLYRDYLSPSMVTSDGISLLTTYAGYCGLGKLPSK